MTGRSLRAVAVLALLIGGVAGCAGAPPQASAPASPSPDATLAAPGSAVPDLLAALGTTYECGGVAFPVAAWETRRPLSELSPVRQTVVDQAMLEPEQRAAADEWFVVEDTPGLLTVMRERSADEGADPAWPHDDADLLRISASAGETNLEDGWIPISMTTCAVTVPMGGLDTVGVWLDPAHPPEATDRTLQLLVVESGCHDAEAVADAIEVVGVAEDASTIAVALGARVFSGPQPACSDGPVVPITVELDAPVGDRTIVDGARASAPEIDVR